MDGVVHFEIPVDDLERAKAFYGTVFDWELQIDPRDAVHDHHDHAGRRADDASRPRPARSTAG